LFPSIRKNKGGKRTGVCISQNTVGHVGDMVIQREKSHAKKEGKSKNKRGGSIIYMFSIPNLI
jgi:hypothetical protein